jgi:putative acetyltransferase
MNPKIVIRSETDADVSAMTEVTIAAFKTLKISSHTEQFIIAALRAAKVLAISLVAEVDGRVIGHIAGLSRLKEMKAKGCCLVGHPDYYRKFGFKNTPGLVVEGVPPEVFFALSFDGQAPQGTVTFHDGFKAEA